MPRATKRILDDEVLDKTMQLFWQKGYFNVSIEDILQTTGFNRSAIYNHFGNKNGLFVAMLKRYREQITPKLTLSLQDSQRGLKAIEDFLVQFARMHSEDKLHHGCFLIATASDIPSHNQEIIDSIHEFTDYLNKLFCDIFDTMKNKHNMNESIDSRSLGDFMVANVFGLLSLCRMHVPTHVIDNQIKGVMLLLSSLFIKCH